MPGKIIEKLGRVFSDKFREKLERQESLDALVDTLTKKEKKLLAKITHASGDDAETFKMQLEVLQTQLDKARKLRQEAGN